MSNRLSKPKLNSPAMKRAQESCDSLDLETIKVVKPITRNVSPNQDFDRSYSTSPARDVKEVRMKSILAKSAMGHKTPGFGAISPKGLARIVSE